MKSVAMSRTPKAAGSALARTVRAALLAALAIGGAWGCGSPDCAAISEAFAAEAASAQQCDPAAATPCVPYAASTSGLMGVACAGFMGVNPRSASALNALQAAYDQAHCPSPPPLPCPYFSAPTYSCQSETDGGSTCTPAE